MEPAVDTLTKEGSPHGRDTNANINKIIVIPERGGDTDIQIISIECETEQGGQPQDEKPTDDGIPPGEQFTIGSK